MLQKNATCRKRWDCQQWGLVAFSTHTWAGRLAKLADRKGCGRRMVVRKCGVGVWISSLGLFPCKSEAQCLPSETWLCSRPDGPVLHLREPRRPRAQLSLFSPLLFPPLSLFSPSYLSFKPSLLPLLLLFSLFLSSLATSNFEHPSSLLPPPPFTSLSCPLSPPSAVPLFVFLVPLCPLSSPVFIRRVSKRRKGLWGETRSLWEGGHRLNLSSWPLVPVLCSVTSGDITNSNLAQGIWLYVMSERAWTTPAATPSLSLYLPLSPFLFLSLSLPKRCRHLQVFNEAIANIKGAALAVRRGHEGRRKIKKKGKDTQ